MSYRQPQDPIIRFTGERFIPDDTPDESHLAIEHKARYAFALSFADAADIVLDCASGSGYGSYALAQKAAQVIGVDISPEAVAHASEAYRSDNLEYFVGDARTLAQFQDGLFSLVTSFETIEHIVDQEAYLRSIRRVLKPSGTLILSMPNRDFFSMAKLPQGTANPYHVKELSISQLEQLLRPIFPNYALYGQNYYRPNAVAHGAQSILLVANKLPLYRWIKERVPTRFKNSVVEQIGAAPQWDITPLDLTKGVPTNILAVCR